MKPLSAGAKGRAREEACIVVCAHVADGVSPDQGYAIRDALNDVETNGWWFLNPGTFIAVFVAASSGAERAASCEQALRNVAAKDPSWASIGVGVAEGIVAGTFSSADILEQPPFGGAVSQAMRRANQNAS
jgi:hypothetical protein